jgi:topoisomerase-4 subunit A
MVAIKDKKPYQMGILFMIDAFLEHVQTTVIRMAQYDLDRSLIRKEIIEGLIKAVSMIDEIIKLIRSSKDRSSAIDSLVNELSFTKLQAEAIVNLRLYRLSNTDVNDLEIELKNIIEVIATFEKIINDKVYRDNHLKAKFKEFKKMFNYARKSTLSHNVSDIKIDHTEIIEKKDVVIFASYDGYVKCFTKRTFNGNSMVDLVLKEDDIPVCNFYSNTKEKAVFITNKGNYISIPTYKIPENV